MRGEKKEIKRLQLLTVSGGGGGSSVVRAPDS